ncbi:hypothetical protein [Mangrovimonas aestuarii]|uniref:hypothetical protein n=1 Tax=Mangrovimonas aestuarii TaxID=3018443 RepID=UPI002377EED5|nr:hypothetical protein [Mangrovimonas aestuarii]
MRFFKFFQYAYIVFAALFTWDAISNWNDQRNRAYMSLLLAATAVFMFFFRKKFNKRFDKDR